MSQSCKNAGISRLLLHVHSDIEDAAEWFKTPIVFWNIDSVYMKCKKIDVYL
jgi:hypothetical protein